mgnify:CR=1 FL=1
MLESHDSITYNNSSSHALAASGHDSPGVDNLAPNPVLDSSISYASSSFLYGLVTSVEFLCPLGIVVGVIAGRALINYFNSTPTNNIIPGYPFPVNGSVPDISGIPDISSEMPWYAIDFLPNGGFIFDTVSFGVVHKGARLVKDCVFEERPVTKLLWHKLIEAQNNNPETFSEYFRITERIEICKERHYEYYSLMKSGLEVWLERLRDHEGILNKCFERTDDPVIREKILRLMTDNQEIISDIKGALKVLSERMYAWGDHRGFMLDFKTHMLDRIPIDFFGDYFYPIEKDAIRIFNPGALSQGIRVLRDLPPLDYQMYSELMERADFLSECVQNLCITLY